jgi:hypothetical protein
VGPTQDLAVGVGDSAIALSAPAPGRPSPRNEIARSRSGCADRHSWPTLRLAPARLSTYDADDADSAPVSSPEHCDPVGHADGRTQFESVVARVDRRRPETLVGGRMTRSHSNRWPLLTSRLMKYQLHHCTLAGASPRKLTCESTHKRECHAWKGRNERWATRPGYWCGSGSPSLRPSAFTQRCGTDFHPFLPPAASVEALKRGSPSTAARSKNYPGIHFASTRDRATASPGASTPASCLKGA